MSSTDCAYFNPNSRQNGSPLYPCASSARLDVLTLGRLLLLGAQRRVYRRLGAALVLSERVGGYHQLGRLARTDRLAALVLVLSDCSLDMWGTMHCRSVGSRTTQQCRCDYVAELGTSACRDDVAAHREASSSFGRRALRGWHDLVRVGGR